MKPQKSINIFFLTMINLATILSIRNWPMTAEYGLASIPLLLLAMIFFFVPSALVAAELATGWPKKGGVYVWVKEALGDRLGFLAIWLLWVENVVWYPIILSFIAATFAYTFNPSFASNQWYTFSVIVSVIWALTFLNLSGMRLSGWISSLGSILGTLIPGLVIILLGVVWFCLGKPMQIEFTWGALIPHFSHFSDLAFFAGILLSFCGMEMSAVHAADVIEPQKNYPKAIFISGTIIIVLTVLGTVAISMVVAKNEISLVSGGIEAVYKFLTSFGLSKYVPFVAILIACGALGSVSTWIAGPCRGLLAAAERGDFPPFLQRVNKHGMPISFMLTQAVIVTFLSSLFIFMPDVSSSFWILTVLASQLYLIMYILMFISGIVLRYKRAEVTRTYRIGRKGNVGMWIVGICGLIGSIFSIFIGFFPPSSLNIGKFIFFEVF